MTDDVPPPLDHVVEPPPFIPASMLARLTPEGRRRLFKSMLEMRQEADDGSAEKVAINSTYGQMAHVPPPEDE